MLEMKSIHDLDLIDGILFFDTFSLSVFFLRLCYRVAGYLKRNYHKHAIACTVALLNLCRKEVT